MNTHALATLGKTIFVYQQCRINSCPPAPFLHIMCVCQTPPSESICQRLCMLCMLLWVLRVSVCVRATTLKLNDNTRCLLKRSRRKSTGRFFPRGRQNLIDITDSNTFNSKITNIRLILIASYHTAFYHTKISKAFDDFFTFENYRFVYKP